MKNLELTHFYQSVGRINRPDRGRHNQVFQRRCLEALRVDYPPSKVNLGAALQGGYTASELIAIWNFIPLLFSQGRMPLTILPYLVAEVEVPV